MVIETDPGKNAKVKKGSSVTLIISKGTDKLTLEDYTGKNAEAIKKTLEAKGFVVVIETKKVSDMNHVKEGSIIEQSHQKGEKISKDDIFTLYVAEFYVVYPDFVKEKWKEADAKDFCNKHSINVTITYEETSSAEEGVVIKQNRTAGVQVFSGASLQLVVAKKPAPTPSPTPSSSPTPSETPKPSASADPVS